MSADPRTAAVVSLAEVAIDYHIADIAAALLPNLDPALIAVKVAAITEQLDTARRIENRQLDSAAWLDGHRTYRSPEARQQHIEELAHLYRSNAAHDARLLVEADTEAGKATAA